MADFIPKPTDTGTPPDGHDEEMRKKYEEQGKNPTAPPANNDLIAGKYKTYDDLIEAYKNAESKIGEYSAKIKELEAQKAGGEPTPPAPDQDGTEPPAPDGAVDISQFEAEFLEKGELTAESYETLAKAGYPKDTVDRYISGQVALRDKFRNEAFSSIGGEENYNKVMDWAAESLDKAEIESYNKLLGSTDISEVKTALTSLKARFDTTAGAHPELIEGSTPPPNGGDVFESMAQVTAAMADPKYAKDPAYRKMVVEKLQRSNV